jgi:hypothetical protein
VQKDPASSLHALLAALVGGHRGGRREAAISESVVEKTDIRRYSLNSHSNHTRSPIWHASAAMDALFTEYERLAFNFDWATAPLNTWHTPVVACCAYLLLVAALYPRAKSMAAEFKIAKSRGEQRPVTFMTHVFAYHNLGICLASLFMFVGGLFEVYRRVTGAVEYSAHGVQYGEEEKLNWEFLFCESPSTVSKGPIFFWVRICCGNYFHSFR